MKCWKIVLCLGSFLVSGIQANAADRVGNGGEAIVCPHEQGTQVRLLDYYEGEAIRGIIPSLGGSEIEPLAKVSIVIDRIRKFDFDRANLYAKRAQAFNSEARLIPHATLILIPDAHPVAIPTGCELKQVAIQKEPDFPGDPYYIINKDLWDLMDNDSKAGLILHEIIYREAIANGASDSVNSRYFNSTLSSTRLQNASIPQYMQVINAVHFPYHFVWHDPVTGKIWRDAEGMYYREICEKFNSTVATEKEVVSAYPRLGQALSLYGFVGPDSMIWIDVDANPYLYRAELFSDHYQIGYAGHSSNRAMCVSR